jgi:hypothetical protein
MQGSECSRRAFRVRGNLPGGVHVPESRCGVRDVWGYMRNGFVSCHLRRAQRFDNLIGGDRENSAHVCSSMVLRRHGDHTLGQSDPHPETAGLSQREDRLQLRRKHLDGE